MRGRGRAVEGRRKKRLEADGRLLWLLRLSLALGRTPGELAEILTGDDLALYQALVEIDGPFWGEREAAHARLLASVAAAAAGADIPPDDFRLEWTVGAAAGDQAAAHLLPPADGLAIFAARHGLTVETAEAPPQ